MKKATFTGPGEPLKVIDDAIPKVPSEGALIRTSYSGVCHSDVHLRTSAFDLGGGQVMSPFKSYGDGYLGTVFGHEICGMIVAFGDKADAETQDLKIGDCVIVYPWIGCGTCEVCKLGLNNKCAKGGTNDIGLCPNRPGGYATHVAVPECRFLIKVPESVPKSVACMLPCSGATPYAALLKATPYIDQGIKERGQANLLVVGAGGLGLWCIELAKTALFADKKVKIFVADISEDKFAAAKEVGADECIVWDREGTDEDMIKITTKNGERKMDAIVNFVGSAKTAGVSLKSLYHGGILVILGLVGGSLSLQLPLFVMNGITMSGSKTSSLQELVDLVNIVAKLGLRYPRMQFLPLEGVNQALDEMDAGTLNGRAILKFDD